MISATFAIACSSSSPLAAIVMFAPDETPRDITPNIDFKFTFFSFHSSVISDLKGASAPTKTDAGRA